MRYNVYLRRVWDTNGNFENYYGWSPQCKLENVTLRKALRYVSKLYKNLKSGSYYEIYDFKNDETMALFGYFSRGGSLKYVEDIKNEEKQISEIKQIIRENSEKSPKLHEDLKYHQQKLKELRENNYAHE